MFKVQDSVIIRVYRDCFFIRRKSISLVISQKSVLKLKQYLYHLPIGGFIVRIFIGRPTFNQPEIGRTDMTVWFGTNFVKTECPAEYK